MGRIIAFTGAHGTGKTTSVFEYAARMKKEGAYEIGIITETARRCPLPIFGKGTSTSAAAQMWIFAEQIRCEIDSMLTYDLTIADRTAVDVVAYSFLAGMEALGKAQLEVVRHHVESYERLYIKPLDNNKYLFDDGVRSTDGITQRALERIIVELYRSLNLSLIPVASK